MHGDHYYNNFCLVAEKQKRSGCPLVANGWIYHGLSILWDIVLPLSEILQVQTLCHGGISSECACVCLHQVIFIVGNSLWLYGLCQAPLFTRLSRQEYAFLLGNLPYPGIEPTSLTSPALVGKFFTTSTTWEALWVYLGEMHWGT